MTKISTPLSADAQKPVVEELQSALTELIDLSLAGKQAHWNVIGPHFRSVHLQLDELVTAARAHADLIAERIAALGGNPNGNPETVVAERSNGAMPTGYLTDANAVQTAVDRLGRSIERVRHAMHVAEENDPPSQDLLNSVLLDLEKQSWMFQAMLPS
jgi:starvation-inducible DNA-binding protein